MDISSVEHFTTVNQSRTISLVWLLPTGYEPGWLQTAHPDTSNTSRTSMHSLDQMPNSYETLNQLSARSHSWQHNSNTSRLQPTLTTAAPFPALYNIYNCDPLHLHYITCPTISAIHLAIRSTTSTFTNYNGIINILPKHGNRTSQPASSAQFFRTILPQASTHYQSFYRLPILLQASNFSINSSIKFQSAPQNATSPIFSSLCITRARSTSKSRRNLAHYRPFSQPLRHSALHIAYTAWIHLISANQFRIGSTSHRRQHKS